MSNALAIAAVTRTLRTLLDHVVTTDFSGLPADTRPTAEIRVTTLPLDRVRNGDGDRAGNQLNLFLYHTEPNPAWRNQDLPRNVRPGEGGHPPLALNLYYILTAYGQDDSELVSHVLLGTAMRILHDHPVLGREDLRLALAQSEVDAQVERVRITPQPVSLDEVSKLWTGFQSEYRLSAAYQVSLVLIESLRAPRAPLPVLRRGEEDRGASVLAAPGPTLLGIRRFVDPALTEPPRHGKPAAELGDVVVLEGTHLGGDLFTARLRHPRLEGALELAPEPERSDTEVRVALPAAGDAGVPARWPAGFYTIELLQERPGLPSSTTNRLPFGLAPTITSLDPASVAEGAQPFDLEVRCTPQVLADQRAVLLLGDREVWPESVVTPADPDGETTLVFPIDGLTQGAHVVRLRVDGVDSVPIDFSVAVLRFDEDQTLEITP